MSKKCIEASKLARLKARTRVIQSAGRVGFIACGVALGFVVLATAAPQRRELKKLEARLEQTKQQERLANEEREQKRIELRALREDPEFLEIHARDRLDYCQEGEKILRFKRDR
jgi:hypothetical protein